MPPLFSNENTLAGIDQHEQQSADEKTQQNRNKGARCQWCIPLVMC